MKKLLISFSIVVFMFLPFVQSISAETGSISNIYSVSTFDDLSARIAMAPDDGTETIILINNDIIFSSLITINNGQSITIKSSGESPYKLIQSNERHFDVNGSLTIEDIILDGDKTGGGVVVLDSTFTMLDGSEVINCKALEGGGISILNGYFFMKGGTITENLSETGGGIYAADSAIDITGGEIISNTVFCNKYTALGGGITITNCTLHISGSVKLQDNSAIGDNMSALGGGISARTSIVDISQDVQIVSNKAVSNATESGNISGAGGGIHAQDNELRISDNVNISDNLASGLTSFGGGLLILDKASLIVSGNTVISGNTADAGGGIYTVDAMYNNLSLDEGTVFSGNKASEAYLPPDNAANLYPNIQFASTSVAAHPLNNYDINYISDETLDFDVIYNSNGGNGSYIDPDNQPGDPEVIESPEEIGIYNTTNQDFMGWNTEADGSGTSYDPGDEIILNTDVTLYAIWLPNIVESPETDDISKLFWIYVLCISLITMFVWKKKPNPHA